MNASISKKPLKKPWKVDAESPTPIEGPYFNVIVLDVRNAVTREVQKWSQPMIEPAHFGHPLNHQDRVSGLVALVRRQYNSRMEYLVQAKAEPGNDTRGGVVLAPSIEASYSNIKKHPGKIPLMNHLDLKSEKTQTATQPKDGGRFFKANNLLVMQSVEKHTFPVPETHIWATREAIREIQRLGLSNEHLNAIIGVFG